MRNLISKMNVRAAMILAVMIYLFALPTEALAQNAVSDSQSGTVKKRAGQDNNGNGEGNGENLAEELTYGDVDCNGDVNIYDVRLLNRYLLGTSTLTEQGKKNAYVDGNQTIDTNDSLNILKCVKGLIEQSEFPIK